MTEVRIRDTGFNCDAAQLPVNLMRQCSQLQDRLYIDLNWEDTGVIAVSVDYTTVAGWWFTVYVSSSISKALQQTVCNAMPREWRGADVVCKTVGSPGKAANESFLAAMKAYGQERQDKAKRKSRLEEEQQLFDAVQYKEKIRNVEGIGITDKFTAENVKAFLSRSDITVLSFGPSVETGPPYNSIVVPITVQVPTDIYKRHFPYTEW